MVTSKLYPPAINYAVFYNAPPEEAISNVLKVKITGTDKHISFPIKVYKTSGECTQISVSNFCIVQVCA